MAGAKYQLVSECGTISEVFTSFEAAHRWLIKEYPTYRVWVNAEGTEREKLKERVLPSVCTIRRIVD